MVGACTCVWGTQGSAHCFCSALNGVDSQGDTGHRDICVPAALQEQCQDSTAPGAALTQPRCMNRRGQSTNLGLSINTNLFSFQSRDGVKQQGQQHHSTRLPEH